MLIGWMLAGSTGSLLAGYFKPDWQETTLFGQKIWFQVGGLTQHAMHIYASLAIKYLKKLESHL